jgi:hypothetical protein
MGKWGESVYGRLTTYLMITYNPYSGDGLRAELTSELARGYPDLTGLDKQPNPTR